MGNSTAKEWDGQEASSGQARVYKEVIYVAFTYAPRVRPAQNSWDYYVIRHSAPRRRLESSPEGLEMRPVSVGTMNYEHIIHGYDIYA